MIGRLRGRIDELEPGKVIVDVGGVGYLVATPLRPLPGAGAAGETVLWVSTQVRDAAITLFGFPSRSELHAFERLIGVAGVGPRTALGVLSGMSAADLEAAVEGADVQKLQRAPGVGRKTAERIVLELKGRLNGPVGGQAAGDVFADAVSALNNLGYPEKQALRAVNGIRHHAEARDLTSVLRLALQVLTA